MKILAIRGANLASLEGEFELVLDAGPLAEAGVFAICGPTGAGKSTLLDAMCLALFDTAPRLDGSSRVRVGRDPDDDARITTTDPRSVLRKGAGEGWAEVDFRGVDDAIYRARWEARRARGRADGKLQPTVMKLEALGTGSRWEGRKTDVRDEIERRLGLSFDQFRRSVLLAQGDFAAFLEADPKDRADLLERMTGTAIYGAISQEAHARAGREKVALDQLAALRGAIAPMTAEEREGHAARAEALAIRVRQDELDKSDAERALRWHHEREALLRDEVAAAEDEARIERQLALWETRRRELADYEVVRPIAPLFRARELASARAAQRADDVAAAAAAAAEAAAGLTAAQASEGSARDALEAAEAERERVRAVAERARALDERLASARKVAEERAAAEAAAIAALDAARGSEAALTARADALAEAVASHLRWLERDPAASLVTDWARTEDRLARLVALHARRAALEGRRAAARAALERAGLDDARAAGRLLGLERTRRELEAAWEEERAVARAAPSEALVDVRERWVARRTALETLVGLADKAQQAYEAERRHRERAARALDAAARADLEGAEAAARARDGAIRIEELEAQRDRVRAALDLSGHRAELVDGEPCPLCGSEEHPYAHEVPMLDALARDADARLRELRDAWQRDETRAALAAEEAARDRRTHEEATREAASWAEALGRAREGYREAAASLGTGAWPRELPAAPGERKDWGPLFDLAGPAATGALLEADALGALREARQEAVEKLHAIEQTERQRRDRERVAAELGQRWEAAVRAEAEAREERVDAARRLDTAVHEASALERERDLGATELRDLEAALDPAVSPWWAGRMAARPRASAAGDLEVLSSDRPREPRAWALDAVADAEGFASSAREAATARLARLAELDSTRDALRDSAPARERARAERVAAEALASAAREACALASAGVTALGAERAAVLEGEADAVEGAVRAALEAARAAVEVARRAVEAARAQAARADARAEASSAELAAARAAHAEAERELDAALERSGLDRDRALERLRLDPVELDGWRAELERLDRERSEAEAVRAERARKRELHEATDAPPQDREAAAARRDAAQKRVEETRELLHAVRGRLERDDEDRARAAALDAELTEARARVEVWITLAELIGSASGNKLRVFAQSLTLELLLEHANHHLATLARRYALQRVPGEDLALQVVDHEMGDEVRSVGSLSGGESFLVALGLALGLASLSSERARVDSLFIDEGFGALDPESLETVLSTLDTLQAGGRQVGIISHVPIIAERFETRVHVFPAGPARSAVALVTRA